MSKYKGPYKRRAKGSTDNCELFQKGSISPTMPELGGMFKPGKFVDRTKQIESATTDTFNGTSGLVPGHKIMSGMS